MSPDHHATAVRARMLVFALLLGAEAQPQEQAQGIRPIEYRVDPRAHAASARLQSVAIVDSAYHRPRNIWIYTPKGYDARSAKTYPLIIAFDGLVYRDTMPLPLILDTLLAARQAPAFIGVLIDDGESGVRIGDLANAAKMTDFLGRQLIPYLRTHWHVTTNPQRAIVTGSSAGGLASAFVAFKRPDLIGNVLSQSGAFWRGAEASDNAPFEWLTAQVAESPVRAVRFVVDVGEYEDHLTLGGAGPNFLGANRRFRDALVAKGYQLTYFEVPRGQHGPAYWMTRLPLGIIALTRDWRD